MQHHLLSSEMVKLSVYDVTKKSDEEAEMMMAEMRWGSKDEQVCPRCGSVRAHYRIRTRKQWRCKDCNSTFSVTSATPFADQKLGYSKLLTAIITYVVHHKGNPALEMRRHIGVHYRTAFVLLQKIREALLLTREQTKLSGQVEIDGRHCSGRPRKPRTKSQSTRETKTIPNKYAAPRVKQHRDKAGPTDNADHPNRRIAITLREVSPKKGEGAVRTKTEICLSENKYDIAAMVREHVAPGSTIATDEHGAYRVLNKMGYGHETVNHTVEFSTDKGVNQNQAESFFSRLDRAEIGIHHRITPRYLADYVNEMAWREDVRKMTTAQQFYNLIERICWAGISKDWFNYCRGNKRPKELLYSG